MTIPKGMNRRHFMSHMAGASAMTIPALTFGNAIRANAQELKRKRKSAIMLWMSGGPSTMDLWDLKPGATTGGPFQQISTSGDVQISEHLPMTAKVMDKLAIVRSMTSPLGEHNFATHYMMTGYKPSPALEYPTFGAVLAHVREPTGVLPPHMAVPSFQVGGGRLTGGGDLPRPTCPFSVARQKQCFTALPNGAEVVSEIVG